MRTTTNFSRENAVGQIGEQVFVDLLTEDGHADAIVDVRLDREYQRKDIDFLVYDKAYEVKADKRASETGNIVLELFIDRRGERIPGYFNMTEADVLIYVDIVGQIVYRADIDEVRALVKDNSFRTTQYYTNDGGTHKTMTLLLVPIKKLETLTSFAAVEYLTEEI